MCVFVSKVIKGSGRKACSVPRSNGQQGEVTKNYDKTIHVYVWVCVHVHVYTHTHTCDTCTYCLLYIHRGV